MANGKGPDDERSSSHNRHAAHSSSFVACTADVPIAHRTRSQALPSQPSSPDSSGSEAPEADPSALVQLHHAIQALTVELVQDRQANNRLRYDLDSNMDDLRARIERLQSGLPHPDTDARREPPVAPVIVAPAAPVQEAPAAPVPVAQPDVPRNSEIPSSSHAAASDEPVHRQMFPAAISSLVQTAFKDFKRRHLQADRSAEFLRKLKIFKDSGSLPKNLQVKPPKISINDPEGNALLASELDSIQADTNQRFLTAYISAMEIATKNHGKAIDDLVSGFSASLNSTIESVKQQPFLGSFSVPSDSWLSSAKDLFESDCNNFLLDKILKKNARDAAAASRQDARDAAMTEADQIPIEKSIAELINDKLSQKFGSLQSEIKELRSLLSKSDPSSSQAPPLKKKTKSAKKKNPSLSAKQNLSVPENQPVQSVPAQKQSTQKQSTEKISGPKNQSKNGLRSGSNSRKNTSNASGRRRSKSPSVQNADRSVKFAEPLTSSAPEAPKRARGRGRNRHRSQSQNRGRSNSQTRRATQGARDSA